MLMNAPGNRCIVRVPFITQTFSVAKQVALVKGKLIESTHVDGIRFDRASRGSKNDSLVHAECA
jgi:hypothetical protein